MLASSAEINCGRFCFRDRESARRVERIQFNLHHRISPCVCQREESRAHWNRRAREAFSMINCTVEWMKECDFGCFSFYISGPWDDECRIIFHRDDDDWVDTREKRNKKRRNVLHINPLHEYQRKTRLDFFYANFLRSFVAAQRRWIHFFFSFFVRCVPTFRHH